MKFLSFLPNASRILARLDSIVTWVTIILGGIVLAGMTTLSIFNVLIMRKALNNPIYGAEDVMVLALVVVVALAIPFGARAGAHIEIELFETVFSKRFDRFSLIAMKIIGIITMSVMSWRLWLAGGEAAMFGESSQNLLIPFGPFYKVLAVSTAFYAFIMLVELLILAQGDSYKRIDVGGEKK